MCDSLDKEQVTELLAGMAKFSPTLWNIVASPFKINEAGNDEVMAGTGLQEKSIEEPPIWCQCEFCRPMKKEEENVCCQNAWKNHEHPLFDNHILTEHNLELAMQSNADFLNYPFDPANNSSWRYTAYRQYIIWVWGKLGYRNRKVVPSCVVWKIRDRFPDPTGNYTGFMDAEYHI